MKKHVLALLMSVILCFALAGCGGGEGEEPASPEPEEPAKAELVADSVAGDWKCVDASMEDSGSTFDKGDMEEMFGMKVGKLAHLTAYGDGTGTFNLMGEEAQVTWAEGEDGYTITIPGAGDGGGDQVMTATLAENILTVTSESVYDNNGEEAKTIMTFTFEYQGKISSILEGWDLQMTDEEVLAMSNFINGGNFIAVDGNLYGTFGGKKFGKGTFSMAAIQDGDQADVKDRKAVEKNSSAYYLTEHDGFIYGIVNWEKIVKVKAGETKAETIYEGTCCYLQAKGDKLYFTDESYKLMSMDLDGKNVEPAIDQSDMYYPYVLPNDTVVYQNDPDNESWHIYDLKTGKDVKLNDTVSYCPIIYGDYLYYVCPTSDEDKYTFHRLDLYSGAVETAPGDMMGSEFFIENGKITFGVGGLPTLDVADWDKLSETGYGGIVSTARYSDGSIRISMASDGESYITNKAFVKEGKTSIGYNYVAQ